MFQLSNVKKNGVLDIACLAIPERRITCIVGASGSGKTTLLRLLNAMHSCDEGEILFRGAPIDRIDPVELRRQVVMLQQSPAIFRGTVRDNLQIGLRFAEQPPATDEELRSVLAALRLRKEPDQDAESLSGGEKQRLALARVLLMRPQALLLDEPTSALDERTSQEAMELVAEQVRLAEGTLVMVTHAMAVVRSFADYIVEIDGGRVVSAGEASRVGDAGAAGKADGAEGGEGDERRH